MVWDWFGHRPTLCIYNCVSLGDGVGLVQAYTLYLHINCVGLGDGVGLVQAYTLYLQLCESW